MGKNGQNLRKLHYMKFYTSCLMKYALGCFIRSEFDVFVLNESHESSSDSDS